MKQVVEALKLELSQYEEVARFARFGTEVNETTQRQIDRGKRLEKLLEQEPHKPVSFVDQVLIFYAFTHGFMDDIPPAMIGAFSTELISYAQHHAAQAVDQIHYSRAYDLDSEEQLVNVFNDFVELWQKKRVPKI